MDRSLIAELQAFRASLADLAQRLADGPRPRYEEVREEADMLASLLDEAPAALWPEIEYLQDRYDAILKSLAN